MEAASARLAPLPRAAPARGVLRLQLELRWRDSVLVSRSYEQGVYAGPTKWFPFPIEGFDCEPAGFVLARREADAFVVVPPRGAQPARETRLTEGGAATFRRGELSLRAWVTREVQVETLDWLWVVLSPLALYAAWKLVHWFGIVFGLLLILLPRPHAPVIPADAEARLHPVRLVVPKPVELQPPLPERPRDRLRLLMEGKRSNDIFQAAARAAASKPKPPPPARVQGLLKLLGSRDELALIGVLGAGPSTFAALDRARPGADLEIGVEGGAVGGIVGGQVGGLGLRGVGAGGGGTGLGLGGLGTLGEGRGVGGLGTSGVGELRGGSGRGLHTAALSAARQRARAASEACFGDEEGRVRVRLAVHPDGSVSPRVLSSSAPARVLECLQRQMKQWQLPAGEREESLTLVFEAD